MSPGDAVSSVQEKVLEYLDAGTRLVWVVEPRTRSISVYRPDRRAVVLGPDDELTGGEVLPGFRLRVKDLFAR